MEITLTANGLDLSRKLSTYELTKDVVYRKVITTLDDVEHPYPGAQRCVVTFSLFPITDGESTELYDALYPLIIPVTFTNPYTSMDETRQMRVVSNIESTFALLSVDGKRRYKGSQIQLREL